MIVIKNIAKVKYEEHDEVWAIVRSMKHPNANITQVSDLSPSWDLFKKYRDLKDKGLWNEDAFQTIYVPQFLKEIKPNPKAIELLNQLYQIDKAGDNICLVCFCPDERLCHRSIIAGLLQGVGCNVDGVDNDYRCYYKQWTELNINKEPMTFRDEYYFLSNMFQAPITLDIGYGLSNAQYITFSCAESAYQAFKDPSRMHEFVNLNGVDARKLGRKVNIRHDWHDINLDLMETIVRAKFAQHPDLMVKLKAVQGQIEENNTWGDTFWGICNGVGENRLGKLLMKIRDEQ